MAEDEPKYADIKIAALMSVPVVGWNHHWGFAGGARFTSSASRSAWPSGVFWHQCLSNLMQDCIDDGLDWLLFLDYDLDFLGRATGAAC